MRFLLALALLAAPIAAHAQSNPPPPSSIYKQHGTWVPQTFSNGLTSGGDIATTSVNRLIITQPATAAQLTIANNKALTATNSLTLSGADGSVVTLPNGTVPGVASPQTWTAPQTFRATTFPQLSFGTLVAPTLILDPSAETEVNNVINQINLTSGDTNQEVLGFHSQMRTNPGHFNYGVEGHTSAGYFHSYGVNTLPLAGCTPGVNCPGAIYAITGLVAMADNEGTGPIQHVWAQVFHGPGTPVTGGSIDDLAYAQVEPCVSGYHASFCRQWESAGWMYAGFGTTAPMAQIHSRSIDTSGTANAYIVGTVLTLASRPTNQALLPNCAVSGGGVSGGTVLIQPAQNPNGNGLTYTINNSQTVGSLGSPVTMTFTCHDVPIILQNISGNTDLDWIIQTGGTTPSAYISGRFDNANGFSLNFGLGAGSAATGMVFMKNGGATTARLGIGYGDGFPGYTLDANGDINATGIYRVGGVAGVSCSGSPTSGFVSVSGIVTHC